MRKMNRFPQAPQQSVSLSRREALRRAAGAGALLSLSALGLGIPASAEAAEGETFGRFPKHPQWKFVFVNHVTTNPFFVPTRYGAEDACALLGCTYQWTGSEKSDVGEMLSVPTRWVLQAARQGAIPCVPVGRYRRFRQASIIEWIAQRERPAGCQEQVRGSRTPQRRAVPASSPRTSGLL